MLRKEKGKAPQKKKTNNFSAFVFVKKDPHNRKGKGDPRRKKAYPSMKENNPRPSLRERRALVSKESYF